MRATHGISLSINYKSFTIESSHFNSSPVYCEFCFTRSPFIPSVVMSGEPVDLDSLPKIISPNENVEERKELAEVVVEELQFIEVISFRDKNNDDSKNK